MEIAFVTWNFWKFEEMKSRVHSNILLTQEEVELVEPQMESLTEISKYKASKAFEALQKPLIVDDTWVYFNAFDNFPGAFWKFVFNWMWINWLKKLFSSLDDSSWSMQTVISYMEPGLDEPIAFVGKTEWSFNPWLIENNPKDGLPFNYIFIPDGWKHPVASFPEEWSSGPSQRNQAVIKLNNYLEKIL